MTVADDRPPGSSTPTLPSRDFPADYPDSSARFADFLTIGIGFGVTIKAECLAAVGRFDTELVVTEDDDLLFRIVSAGFVPVVVPDTRIVVHQHDGPRLTAEQMDPRRIREARRLLTTYAPFLALHPAVRAQVVSNIEFLEARVRARPDRGLAPAPPGT